MHKKIVSITIGIAVKDVKKATEWYSQLLGNNIEMIEPAPGTIEIKLTDNVWLQLDDTGYLKLGGDSSIIRLETMDIETAHKMVNTLTENIDEIQVVENVVKYFDFKDPWDNRLSYFQLF